MSSPPDKLLLKESITSPSAAGLISTIEGLLLVFGAARLSTSITSRRWQLMNDERLRPLSFISGRHPELECNIYCSSRIWPPRASLLGSACGFLACGPWLGPPDMP